MCLGELASVGGEDVLPHVPALMDVIIARLSDPAIVKRDAALHTLGQVCSNTGYVITPLVDYPQLLPVLSRILRAETSQSVRREVIKVLGLLGALDPYRRKVSRRVYLEKSDNKAAIANVHRASQRKRRPMSWQTLLLPIVLRQGICLLRHPLQMIIIRPLRSMRSSASCVINRKLVSIIKSLKQSCRYSRRKG